VTNVPSVVYLIHFATPLAHAQHYVGFCQSYESVESRLSYHMRGQGSRLLRAVSAAGIAWDIVRIWRGTRNDERALKNTNNSRAYCPVCSARPATRRGLTVLQ
jgi:hypothetical protein